MAEYYIDVSNLILFLKCGEYESSEDIIKFIENNVTTDVIERSKHDVVVQACKIMVEIKNVNLIAMQDKYYALEKEYAELKANVDKAIEEIKNINPIYSTIGDRISVSKNCDDIKAEVLEILKRNIGE